MSVADGHGQRVTTARGGSIGDATLQGMIDVIDGAGELQGAVAAVEAADDAQAAAGTDGLDRGEGAVRDTDGDRQRIGAGFVVGYRGSGEFHRAGRGGNQLRLPVIRTECQRRSAKGDQCAVSADRVAVLVVAVMEAVEAGGHQSGYRIDIADKGLETAGARGGGRVSAEQVGGVAGEHDMVSVR